MDQWPGLSRIEAADRLAHFGPNSLPVPGYRLLRLILRQFAGVFNLLLLAAAAVTFALGETMDAWFIMRGCNIFPSRLYGLRQHSGVDLPGQH